MRVFVYDVKVEDYRTKICHSLTYKFKLCIKISGRCSIIKKKYGVARARKLTARKITMTAEFDTQKLGLIYAD